MSTVPMQEFLTGLDAWLEQATRGLCLEAAVRISREVKEHCLASLEAKLYAGIPLDAAARAVLAELGSWRAARRAFRKANLTYAEDLCLQVITIKRSQWIHGGVLLMAAASVCLFAGVFVPAGMPVSTLIPLILIALFYLMPHWALPLIQRMYGTDDPRRLIRAFALAQFVAICVMMPAMFLEALYQIAKPPFVSIFLAPQLVFLFTGAFFPKLTWKLQYKLTPSEEGPKT